MRAIVLPRITIIQHCQSQHHVNGLTGGWTDTGLTHLGKRQAAALAVRLKAEWAGRDVKIWSSDLKRAAETAEVVRDATGSALAFEPNLREFNNGVSAGQTEDWASEHRRPAPSDGSTLDWQPFDEAETWRTFYRRIASAMDEIVRADQGPLAISTHGGALSQIVSWWLRLTEDQLATVEFSATPGSITTLGVGRNDQRLLLSLNDRCHLQSVD